MNPALQKYLDAASGWTSLTAKKAEQIVKQLVRSGEAASDQVGDLVDDLLERQRGNREAMTALVRSETTRAVRAMGLATSTEVERLQRQVADLKRELQDVELERGSGTGSRTSGATGAGKRTRAKKTSGKKTAGKKTGGKKTGAKKTAAKTTSAKKTAARKTAKKATKRTGSGSGS